MLGTYRIVTTFRDETTEWSSSVVVIGMVQAAERFQRQAQTKDVIRVVIFAEVERWEK